ncbi:phage holin family protein [Streptomyces sp. F63]|uniref:phage holin family protein n=1 Tax=Streptomyces sp. F63 TaxID=2824887 RepID=UPI001B381ED2|nr:phage holin family protein [Streptomyces sp. F63]MBQ0987137.1 phage holin family protein [Streptomyces sp. F63]
MTTTVNRRPAGRDTGEPSAGDLVKQAAEQLSDLVRGEMRLAQAELARKGRRAGLGGGLFGGAGIVAFVAFQALVVAGIAALALVLPLWAAALIGAAALLAVAGVLAALGRKQTREAAPLVPEEAIRGMRTDAERIKERAHR